MSGMKIKKGDTVIILSGSEKGKTGKITATNPTEQTVTIDGINVRTIHEKPSSQYPQGGVIKESKPITVSKVGIIHPTNKKKSSRIGYEMNKDKKVRVFRQASNKEIK